VNLRGVLIPLGERGPVLLYAVSRRTVDEDLQFISRAVSGIFVAAMVLTSLVARWLSARLSIDVLSIAGVARAVAQGDLHARVGSYDRPARLPRDGAAHVHRTRRA
jgi:two-component system heavy metal sensor histidine kinase CusS